MLLGEEGGLGMGRQIIGNGKAKTYPSQQAKIGPILAAMMGQHWHPNIDPMQFAHWPNIGPLHWRNVGPIWEAKHGPM